LCAKVRIDLDDVSLRLTPGDAFSEGSWSVYMKVRRNDEGCDLATRKIDEFGGDSDGRWAEAYCAAKMDQFWYSIPTWREEWIFSVSRL
jgi:hypothetical protein